MGTSTVSGPFRSENGFQELVDGVWTPVGGGGGGGGGGVTFVALGTGSDPTAPDNRYSNNYNNNPPTGATAGTIVTLPIIEVGETARVYMPNGSSTSAWALQLPTIPGIDICSFKFSKIPYFWEYIAPGTTNIEGSIINFEPDLGDPIYIYGILQGVLDFIRLPDFVVPGFGTVAFYTPIGTWTGSITINGLAQIFDVSVYPFQYYSPT